MKWTNQDVQFQKPKKIHPYYDRMIDLYKDQVKKRDEQIKDLKERLLQSEAQNYCKICGSTLDGYVPPGSEDSPDISH